jgi:methyl-accepting chemotaxis protein
LRLESPARLSSSIATREISASVSRAASGTQVVVENIATVGENISQASGATRELLSASHELSDQFRTLETKVQAFVATVRGAR